MRHKFFILVIILWLAGSVSAQTPTPCNPGVDVGNLNLGGNCKSNEIDPDTKSDLYRGMATAAASINALPEQIEASGPGGQRIAETTAGMKQLFGYVKWLLSPATAEELLGKDFAPYGTTALAWLVVILSLTAIWFVINLIVMIIKFVVWMVNQFLKLVPFW